MPSARQGSIHLFRLAGIDLYLHWSWFLVAAYEVESRRGRYSSITWNLLEYLALFAIVLTHEFGHALACRQVGGTANRILLWPLGGVAYVDPPQRPGATLWSIAAGPLVNVVLLPLLFIAVLLGESLGWPDAMPNAHIFLRQVFFINASLLVFNILPIYPLDGGQILRSLLWFFIGRARSLMAATVLGLVGIAGFFALAVWQQSLWIGAISVFMLMNCWGGLQNARELLRLMKLPRRAGYACPGCHAAPLVGNRWQCWMCGQPFDAFASAGACQNCSAPNAVMPCPDCGQQHPIGEWAVGAGATQLSGGQAAR